MRLALFDVDGTLVNSRSMITASLVAAFASENLPPPPPLRLMSVVGLSLVDAMRELVPEIGEQRHQHLAAAYKEAFWAFRASGEHSEDLFEGARGLLEHLRARPDVQLGIVTGKSRRGMAHLFETHGLAGWFATVQTSDDHPSKPNPSMVQQALAETGAAPASTVVIGDTSFDMAMARAAGVRAIGVSWGNHPVDELRQAGAHSISNDFNELQKQLESLWQERAA
jgi:phosphoglycolate phosphatase